MNKKMKTLAAFIGVCNIFLAVMTVGGQSSKNKERIMTADLSGEWRFDIDKQNVGVSDQWFLSDLAKTIRLPGSMSENGYGTYGSPGTSGVKGWASWKDNPLWHPVLRKDYRGGAWYQRDIEIPAAWKGQHIRLHLERVCWVSELWVDERHVGRQESLSAPHIFDIGSLTPGKHRLSIRVDNRQLHYIGCNTHAYHEQSVTIFNGIIGKIELSARPQVFIEENQVFSNPDTGLCTYRMKINNTTQIRTDCVFSGEIDGFTARKELAVMPGQSTVELDVQLPRKGIKLWGEFEQPLYTAHATLKTPKGIDSLAVTFGFRKLEAKGHQFIINGRPVMMRGEANNAMFPLTGYPPMGVDEWRKIFTTFKSYGLNHFRCHAWTPPEAAFIAADELGIFIQPELPNGETAVHDKEGNPWREQEFYKILNTYGNHPSFALYSHGNEAKTTKVDFFIDLTEKGRKYDSRHLYTMMSNPHASRKPDGFDCDEYVVSHSNGRRLERSLNHKVPSTTGDYRKTFHRDIPYISHETGQWYVYPDTRTISKYTGVIEPRNLIEFKKRLKDNGLWEQAADFVDASGRLSLELYKEEIEHSLRTPNYGGFQLLGLQDSYDQGSAFVGHIDNFFDPKPYVTASQFRRFCAPEVPLARFEKRVWLNNETFAAQIELANYGPAPLKDKVVQWTLVSGITLIDSGSFGPVTIPNTGLVSIGDISCVLKHQSKAAKMTLSVRVDGTEIANAWDLWVYPATLEMPNTQDVIVTTRLTADIDRKLRAGAKVVMFPRQFKSKYATAMTSPFWSPLMFGNQKQIIGFICQTEHPALKNFPTDSHNNWQWWELTRNGSAMDVSDMGADYRPIVQGIDQPQRCKRLGIVYEGTVGQGRLLICSLDVNRDLNKRPVARQLRYSLLTYAASDQFQPKNELNTGELVSTKDRVSVLVTKSLVKSVSVDSEHENNWGIFAVDGNRNTIWHTRWDDTQTPHPHHFTVELKKKIRIRGIVQTPRRDSQNGCIAKYRVYVSNDGKAWQKVASGTWKSSEAPQRVIFKEPVITRFIKLEALSEVNGKPWTSMAELDIIP